MKVLLVDDENDFLKQSKIFLEKEDDRLNIETTTSARRALEMLNEDDYDVIVSDYQMPGMNGLEFLETVREERNVEKPFIIFTGKSREEVAIEALNLGADRYLQKGGDPTAQYGLLAESIVQEYERWISQRKLEESEEEKALILNSGSEHIAFHDPDHNLMWVNEAYAEDLGKEPEEIKDEKCYELWYDLEEPCENCPVVMAIREGEEREEEVSPPGSDLYWLIKGKPVTDEEGNVIGAVETAIDITERKKTEEELEEKNRQLETLFGNLPGMAFRCLNNENWTMKFLSNGCEELTGYSTESLIDDEDISYAELIFDDDEEYVWDEIQKSLENQESYEITYRIVTADGKIKWVWEQGKGIYDEGDLKFLEGFIQDVTERKEYRERLEKYKNAVKASDDSIYMLDDDYCYVFANKEHINRLYEDGKISEKSEDVIVGEKYEMVHSEKDLESLKENIEKVLETGEVATEDYEFLTEDKWSRRTFSPYKSSENGEVKGVVIVSKDITERKEAEERREFLHSLLRHDVRNKIQVLHGYNELLREGKLDSEEKEYAEKMKNVIEDTIDLIEKVRALRKAEEEEVTTVDLVPLLHESIEGCGASANDMEVRMDIDDSLESFDVEGGRLLSEVFSNVIENSVQHSKGDLLRVSIEDEEDYFVCVFEDDGVGVPDSEKVNIFDKGYKGDDTTGSGLGMFLVKKLVEIYDGYVDVKDSDLGGARFEIGLRKTKN